MKHVLNDRLPAAIVLAACLAAQAPARGAADRGEFGIKGIGATTCATVVHEYKAGTPNAMMYGGWLYGYMTAMNQTTAATFDLAPWQDLNTLTNFLVSYCAKNPKTTYAQAVFNMTSALKPKRLKSASQPLTLRRDGKSFILYADVLARMAQALKARGFYSGPVEGNKPQYTDELAKAVKAFQARNKLPETGLPDQFTLFRLFEG
jgi:murein L,D-transpeptidase YcbB/YkuD